MAMAQFARVCAITELAFPKKYAIESSTISSLRRPKDWGWVLGSCVRSSNRMAARSQPRMLRAGVRGSILFCQQASQRDGPSNRSLGFHCSSLGSYLLLFLIAPDREIKLKSIVKRRLIVYKRKFTWCGGPVAHKIQGSRNRKRRNSG